MQEKIFFLQKGLDFGRKQCYNTRDKTNMSFEACRKGLCRRRSNTLRNNGLYADDAPEKSITDTEGARRPRAGLLNLSGKRTEYKFLCEGIFFVFPGRFFAGVFVFFILFHTQGGGTKKCGNH